MSQGTKNVRMIENTISRIQKNFECPICLELMKNPVSTPRCHHIFCRHCILQTIGNGTGRKQTAPCPLCKEPFTRRSLQPKLRWNAIVTSVASLVQAFEMDTGVACTPPQHSTVAASLATEKTAVREAPDSPIPSTSTAVHRQTTNVKKITLDQSPVRNNTRSSRRKANDGEVTKPDSCIDDEVAEVPVDEDIQKRERSSLNLSRRYSVQNILSTKKKTSDVKNTSSDDLLAYIGEGPFCGDTPASKKTIDTTLKENSKSHEETRSKSKTAAPQKQPVRQSKRIKSAAGKSAHESYVSDFTDIYEDKGVLQQEKKSRIYVPTISHMKSRERQKIDKWFKEQQTPSPLAPTIIDESPDMDTVNMVSEYDENDHVLQDDIEDEAICMKPFHNNEKRRQTIEVSEREKITKSNNIERNSDKPLNKPVNRSRRGVDKHLETAEICVEEEKCTKPRARPSHRTSCNKGVVEAGTTYELEPVIFDLSQKTVYKKVGGESIDPSNEEDSEVRNKKAAVYIPSQPIVKPVYRTYGKRTTPSKSRTTFEDDTFDLAKTPPKQTSKFFRSREKKTPDRQEIQVVDAGGKSQGDPYEFKLSQRDKIKKKPRTRKKVEKIIYPTLDIDVLKRRSIAKRQKRYSQESILGSRSILGSQSIVRSQSILGSQSEMESLVSKISEAEDHELVFSQQVRDMEEKARSENSPEICEDDENDPDFPIPPRHLQNPSKINSERKSTLRRRSKESASNEQVHSRASSYIEYNDTKLTESNFDHVNTGSGNEQGNDPSSDSEATLPLHQHPNVRTDKDKELATISPSASTQSPEEDINPRKKINHRKYDTNNSQEQTATEVPAEQSNLLSEKKTVDKKSENHNSVRKIMVLDTTIDEKYQLTKTQCPGDWSNVKRMEKELVPPKKVLDIQGGGGEEKAPRRSSRRKKAAKDNVNNSSEDVEMEVIIEDDTQEKEKDTQKEVEQSIIHSEPPPLPDYMSTESEGGNETSALKEESPQDIVPNSVQSNELPTENPNKRKGKKKAKGKQSEIPQPIPEICVKTEFPESPIQKPKPEANITYEEFVDEMPENNTDADLLVCEGQLVDTQPGAKSDQQNRDSYRDEAIDTEEQKATEVVPSTEENVDHIPEETTGEGSLSVGLKITTDESFESILNHIAKIEINQNDEKKLPDAQNEQVEGTQGKVIEGITTQPFEVNTNGGTESFELLEMSEPPPKPRRSRRKTFALNPVSPLNKTRCKKGEEDLSEDHSLRAAAANLLECDSLKDDPLINRDEEKAALVVLKEKDRPGMESIENVDQIEKVDTMEKLYVEENVDPIEKLDAMEKVDAIEKLDAKENVENMYSMEYDDPLENNDPMEENIQVTSKLDKTMEENMNIQLNSCETNSDIEVDKITEPCNELGGNVTEKNESESIVKKKTPKKSQAERENVISDDSSDEEIETPRRKSGRRAVRGIAMRQSPNTKAQIAKLCQRDKPSPSMIKTSLKVEKPLEIELDFTGKGSKGTDIEKPLDGSRRLRSSVFPPETPIDHHQTSKYFKSPLILAEETPAQPRTPHRGRGYGQTPGMPYTYDLSMVEETPELVQAAVTRLQYDGDETQTEESESLLIPPTPATDKLKTKGKRQSRSLNKTKSERQKPSGIKAKRGLRMMDLDIGVKKEPAEYIDEAGRMVLTALPTNPKTPVEIEERDLQADMAIVRELVDELDTRPSKKGPLSIEECSDEEILLPSLEPCKKSNRRQRKSAIKVKRVAVKKEIVEVASYDSSDQEEVVQLRKKSLRNVIEDDISEDEGNIDSDGSATSRGLTSSSLHSSQSELGGTEKEAELKEDVEAMQAKILQLKAELRAKGTDEGKVGVSLQEGDELEEEGMESESDLEDIHYTATCIGDYANNINSDTEEKLGANTKNNLLTKSEIKDNRNFDNQSLKENKDQENETEETCDPNCDHCDNSNASSKSLKRKERHGSDDQDMTEKSDINGPTTDTNHCHEASSEYKEESFALISQSENMSKNNRNIEDDGEGYSVERPSQGLSGDSSKIIPDSLPERMLCENSAKMHEDSRALVTESETMDMNQYRGKSEVRNIASESETLQNEDPLTSTPKANKTPIKSQKAAASSPAPPTPPSPKSLKRPVSYTNPTLDRLANTLSKYKRPYRSLDTMDDSGIEINVEKEVKIEKDSTVRKRKRRLDMDSVLTTEGNVSKSPKLVGQSIEKASSRQGSELTENVQPGRRIGARSIGQERPSMSPLVPRCSPNVSLDTTASSTSYGDTDLPKRPNWCFVLSGISTVRARSRIMKFVKLLGAKESKKIITKATHLIVPPAVNSKDNLFCDRTLKYFQAIAQRLWVVSMKWVEDSLKVGQILPEAEYEIHGDTSVSEPHGGPKRSRVEGGSLLANFEFYFFGDYSSLSKDDIRDLVIKCGGSSVQLDTLFTFNKRLQRVIIAEPQNQKQSTVLRGLYTKHEAPVIAKEWILDSVGQYTVLPVRDYVVDLSVQ